MNVGAHQKKEKNEEAKTGKRKAGEKKRPTTDFNEAVCCSSAVVQGAARRKNGLCEGNVQSNWNPLELKQPFQLNPNWVRDCTNTLGQLLIGAGSVWLGLISRKAFLKRIELSENVT